ncbi:MAG: choice-of-anchor D domain-containing protein, partial [Chloroflexi bacterium]|nr:choice-of-anchor D domain-containing protein [Chloroflexota bacterium]
GELRSRRTVVVLALPPGQSALTLTPGEPAHVEVLVTNRTPAPLTIALAIDGLPAGWVEPAPTLRVAQFASATAALVVTAPALPESAAGPYPVRLRATAQEVPAIASELPLEWRVAPFLAGELHVSPHRCRDRELAVVSVHLRNGGNTRAVYHLRAIAEHQALSFALAEEHIDIDPGSVVETPLTIAASRRIVGTDRDLAFTVEAEESSETQGAITRTISDDAHFVHAALLPAWSPLLALLVLFLLYGFNVPAPLWSTVPGRGFIIGAQVSGAALEATRIVERATQQAAQGQTAIADAAAVLAATQSAVAALPTEQQASAQTALAGAFQATSTVIAAGQTAAAQVLNATEVANNDQLARTRTAEEQQSQTALTQAPLPTATSRPAATATSRPATTATSRPSATPAATPQATAQATVVASASVEVDPSALAFGSIKKGTTSATRIILLRNTSNVALTITAIAIGGVNGADFARVTGGADECGASLAANATCAISLTFSPAVAGTRSGQLRIENTSAGGTILVNLTGAGTEIPEVAAINRVGSSPTNAGSVQFQVNFSEAVRGVSEANFSLVTLGGAVGSSITSVAPASSASTNQWTVTVNVAGGNKTVRLDFINSNGVTNADGNAVEKLPFNTGDQYVIDTTAPQVTLSGTPPALSNNPAAPFTFSGSDDVTASLTFECRVLPAAFAACTSPFTPAGLADGSRTFEVRSRDAAGNASSPASYTWTLDTTPPDTAIATGPANGSTSGPDVSFTFTSEAGATFECRVLPATFATCTSPLNLTGLPEGSRTFEVRARDAAGNADASPATRTWTVDATPPDTTITGGPANGSTSGPDVSFTFTSEAGATFECRVLPAAFAPCTSPQNLTLPGGSRTFEVRARDAVGNIDATPATRTWTVDATPPDTTITGGPTGTVATTSASFTFTSTETGTFQCSLDGAPFTACTSPQNYAGLADGAHTFAVRAIDAVNNIDATPATRTWTVDTTPPDTTITGGPANGSTSGPDVSFTFTSEAGATFECSLDAGAFAACTSPENLTGLADGSRTFRVRARDTAGNVDATPATRTWTVDATPPDTTITGGPANGSTSGPDVSFSFSSTEAGATFECRVLPAAFAPCTSPQNLTLPGGSRTFEVRARDAVGNIDATPASRTWTVDATPPDTSITGGPSGTVNTDSASFTFSSTEAGTFQCSLDGAPFTACTSPQNYAGLADGAHTFAVRAIDTVNNIDSTPATRTWTVDTTPPDTSITGGPAEGSSSGPDVSFTFSSTETGTFQCSLDGAPFTACTSPQNYAGLAAGAHTFAVRAIDTVNNADPTPATRTWTVS